MKPGDRIGAIFSATNETVKLLGYGVYKGDEVPPKGGGWIADALNEANAVNPKLVLDDGQVVWGCQCWWRSEEETRAFVEGLRIELVRMDELLEGVHRQEIEILKHSLGLLRSAEPYRNRFVTGEGSIDYRVCMSLVEKGDMKRLDGHADLIGKDSYIFFVTEQGKKRVGVE